MYVVVVCELGAFFEPFYQRIEAFGKDNSVAYMDDSDSDWDLR